MSATAKAATDSLAIRLYTDAFSRPRELRSREYKVGVMYILQFKTHEATRRPCPYADGSAQADAWAAGTDEGHTIWRAYLERTK